MPMTEAAISTNLWRDLYVSLGDPLPGDLHQWSMRVYYKPFVPWLWVGVLIMVLGGVLAAFDRRYRRVSSSGPLQTVAQAVSSLNAQAPSLKDQFFSDQVGNSAHNLSTVQDQNPDITSEHNSSLNKNSSPNLNSSGAH